MNIIRLQSNNVMRLVAVDITPEGNLITIGGKNGAGKSSVLDSLAMAIGGENFVPAEPIRRGETEGSVRLELDDLIITRRFSRDRIHQEGFGCGLDITTAADKEKVFKACTCTPTFSETRSTLSVTNKEGAKYPSPQTMLNKLLGKLAFDPLAFAQMDAKAQEAVLRSVVNLDTTAIDNARKLAFAERTMLNKTFQIKEAQLLAMPKHDGVPVEELSLDAITEKLAQAERLSAAVGMAAHAKESKARELDTLTGNVTRMQSEVEQLEMRLAEARKTLAVYEREVETVFAKVATLEAARLAAEKAVPDTALLRTELAEAVATNVKVRANQKHAEAFKELDALNVEVLAKTDIIEAADTQKRDMLDKVVFPVPGLSLSDDGITFGGIPFSQASTAEKLRVSVAIGLALNPTLKVLLIRNGNMLDEDSLKLVAEQAAAANAQIWCEWVTKDAADVQVMIVDGEVAHG